MKPIRSLTLFALIVATTATMAANRHLNSNDGRDDGVAARPSGNNGNGDDGVLARPGTNGTGTTFDNGGGTGNNPNVPRSQPRGGGGQNGRNGLSDQAIIRQSAQAALAEIAMGELALSNSQNASVQAFAQELIQDHTTQLAQARALGADLGVTLSDTLARPDSAALKRLSALTGDEFDRAWAQAMVASHSTALGQHDRAAQRARSESVRAYAREQLVPLATHLAKALELAAQLNASSGATTPRQ
jgi:predicted outer membrane protein